MKTSTRMVLGLLLLAGAIIVSIAQDYKHPYGLVKEDGKVLDTLGHHIGWVTKHGEIKDSAGNKVAQISPDGSLLEHKTGKRMGKVQKNGNYVSVYSKTPDDKGWITSPPMNGTCEVKDDKGKLVVVVHENYKQYGACAYHCLTMEKEHKDMKMK